MRKNTQKKCRMCDKAIHPKRPWQEYCSDKCKEDGKKENTQRWREKKLLDYKELTMEEIITSEPYKIAHDKIVKEYKDKSKKKRIDLEKIGISWSELYRISGLPDRNIFKGYLDAIVELGMLIKKENKYFFSERYKYIPLQDRQKDIISTTDIERILFRPAADHSFTYYTPKIYKDYLIDNVDQLGTRLKNIEETLKTAHNEFIGILSEARNTFMRSIWTKNVLENNKLYVLTKLDLCLSLIFHLREDDLLGTNRQRSLNEQNERLDHIIEKALHNYLKTKYPKITDKIINQLDHKIDKNYKDYKSDIDKVYGRISSLYTLSTLDHMMVIDCLFTADDKYKILSHLGIVGLAEFDRDKPMGDIIKKSRESEKTHQYDRILDKKQDIRYNEKLCVKPPFFQNFLKDFEKDLLGLGFKYGKVYGSIEQYYKNLDEMAKILLIPALPENLDGLF